MKSAFICLLFLLTGLGAVFYAKKWEEHKVMQTDVGGYYLYLSSGLVYHDLGDGSYTSVQRALDRPDAGTYGYLAAPNGRTVFKYPLGMAVFYSPGFFIANQYAKSRGLELNAYSLHHQKAVVLMCLVWVVLGLWILRAVLRTYFSDGVTALALLGIGLATNLWCYATFEAPMSHGVLFMLCACLLWATDRWYQTFRPGYALALGLALGFAVLVRPSELLLAGIPVLWGLTSGAAVRARLGALRQHWRQVLLAAAAVLAVACWQLIFWRVIGGAWFIDTYPGEKFDFTQPHVLDGLFSSQKGWLVYSPVMVLALLGIGYVRRRLPAALPPLLVLLPVVLYVTFSWWDWRYGGGFGARPLISLYPLLALPLAALLEKWGGKGWRMVPLTLVICVLAVLSMFQSWQYFMGFLNSYDMTWAMYHNNFFMTHW